ncbi:TRAFAC clade GTPase domain-containing protein [Rivularia sp. UHCC 0363]|uniref:TRAFAC clade GTPase domain-containing protein n=1 Tax=Rivularia sp. UHCC 0363 TaxID=3110244 RepID=UPI002B21424A|nr:ATPase/DNA packaging protein [Rivularia sp. UHCC 0363]MEA5592841.1 ATPase/DNA packaging protein [Rivularia sp. UHCC 0363]
MNNYNILVLGASGSGKTVFLASLFKKLSTQGEFDFCLSAEDTQKRKSLNKIYKELIGGESWPDGTRNTGSWTFDCHTNDPEQLNLVKACTFTYFDYAGGLITDVTEKNDANQFESLTKIASAFLVLLDGQKLLLFMEDEQLSNDVVIEFIHTDLPNLMQLVQECPAKIPVYFVISKWDLLEGKYFLEQVRNKLLNTIPEFYNVVGNRKKAGCPVRLIPISSVGSGFAILENGEMKKIPGKTPQPQNLEMTLAFALTDNPSSRFDNVKSPSNSQKKSGIGKIIGYILLAFFTIILIPVSGLGFIIPIAYFLIRWFMKKNNGVQTKKNQESISNLNAFVQVLNTCQSIEQKFLAEYPESNL